MNNEDYWIIREKEKLNANDKLEKNLLSKAKKLYSDSIKKINKEIESFYGRYAEEHNIDLVSLHKLLDAKHLKSAKENIKNYYNKINNIMSLAEFKNKNLTQYLNQYKNELRELLAKVHISRLEDLKIELKNSLVDLFEKENKLFTSTLKDVYEENYLKTSFSIDNFSDSIKSNFSGLNYKKLNAALNQSWNGDNYSGRIWKNKIKLLESLNTSFLQGVALGHNPRKIAEAISVNYGTAYHNCERLIRTETTYISGQASYQSYLEHDIQKYQFIATLDNRTSAVCQSLDNSVFSIKEKQVGINYPPTHPNCRSTTIPYFEPDKIDKMFDEPQRVARDKNGKLYHVSAGMSYKEWKKTVLKSK